MFNQILSFSIAQRWLVMIAVCGMTALGIYNFGKLPIDAVPDITNVQVQINTEAYGYTPLEVEQRITFPIEFSLSGLPKLSHTRSLSRYGLSQVTVIFEEGTDIYFARQLLNERLQEIRSKLPESLEPTLGPIATGLGEIYTWSVEADTNAKNKVGKPYTLTELRTLQDWIIRPQIRTVKGITEVNTLGGLRKVYLITPYPQKLRAYSLSLRDVVEVVKKNNANIGAGYIEQNGQQLLIRSPGRVKSISDIKQILLKENEGVPVTIAEVADVKIGHNLRTGAATRDGKEVVLGTAMMLMGANSREVSEAVHHKIMEVNKTLPTGVKAIPMYNRTTLVEKTIDTVKENLSLGALLVIVILFIFLGNIRAALITAMVIPLAMCFTVTGMIMNKLSANLMSMGALDFGIIVDGSVVMTENCLRHLSLKQAELGRVLNLKERMNTIWEASKEARQALLFGELIIMLVYLPILTLEGVEGKMFYPMAMTVVLALLGAMILSITFVPAMLTIFMTGKVSEKENKVMHSAKILYQPLLNWALNHRQVILTLSVTLVILSGVMTLKMGREFVPSLDEGDIATHALRVPGTGLTQAINMQYQVDKKLKQHPEVARVFSKIGTAEIATDPMPPSVADTFVMMKPRHEWPNPRLSRIELIEKLQHSVKDLPGNQYEFTQPIQMRFNELLSGVRSDVAVKIFGESFEVLTHKANEMVELLSKISGASDVRMEQISGLPVLSIKPNERQLKRYGLSKADIQDLIQIAGAGSKAGELFDGDKRFDISVRLPEAIRIDLEQLKQLPVPLPHQPSAYVPLEQVADFEIKEDTNQISRENGKRRVVVTANVRGRDMGSFVEEAQQFFQSTLKLESGYWIEWSGEFEKMISATKRLQIVIPVALLFILLLLQTTLKNFKDVLLVFSGVPLALTGGITALVIRGIPLSISAGVGFIALSGIAVLNGLVMLTFMKQLREGGSPLIEAIKEGAITRLRPVLMTALVASLGFIPMALSTGTGAEVQRPLATVVIGGILSSTLLTLFVLPVLFSLAHKDTHLESTKEVN